MPYDVKAAVRPRHNTTGALLDMKGGKRTCGGAEIKLACLCKTGRPPIVNHKLNLASWPLQEQTWLPFATQATISSTILIYYLI